MDEEFKDTQFTVVGIISPTRLVLNCGRNKGVAFDDRFSIYTYGEMQLDPETKQELERVYLPRGTGKVVVLQQKICTIESVERESAGLGALYSVMGSTLSPFDHPQVGDFAKFVKS